MNKTVANLQDLMLNELRTKKVETTVYLANGFQIKGIVKGFDNFVVILDSDGKQQMIYKHAISTVQPAHPVHLDVTGDLEAEVDA